MTNLVEGGDYKFVIPEDDDVAINIELLSGDYSGTVYQYGKVSFEEHEGSNEGYLVFEYTVIESEKTNLEEDIQFKNYIGDVLTTIITKNMEKTPSEVISE